MEWVDHLDRVGQGGAQCAHRQTFRSNFLPQLEEHSICELLGCKRRRIQVLPQNSQIERLERGICPIQAAMQGIQGAGQNWHKLVFRAAVENTPRGFFRAG